MSTVKITASKALAIYYVFRLWEGSLRPHQPIPKPDWKFKFFDEIRASRIEVVKKFRRESKATPFKKAEQVSRGGVEYKRYIDFRLRGTSIVIVELLGVKYAGDTGGQDNGTLWGVTRISFFRFVNSQGTSILPEEIIELNEEPWYHPGLR